MAASATVMKLTEHELDASLIIDEILSQKEKAEIAKMLKDAHILCNPDTLPNKPDKARPDSGDNADIVKYKLDQSNGNGNLLKDASLDDLNNLTKLVITSGKTSKY